MKQAILFVFDISLPTPIVIHSVKLASPISSLSIDTNLNLLLGLTRKGQFINFLLSTSDPKMMNPNVCIDSVATGGPDDSANKIVSFGWVDRRAGYGPASLNCTYLEGSAKGKVWVRDTNQDFDKMLRIPLEFSDKVKAIDYDKDKNVVVMSCRDGRMSCFKLPGSWGTKEMEILDTEI